MTIAVSSGSHLVQSTWLPSRYTHARIACSCLPLLMRLSWCSTAEQQNCLPCYVASAATSCDCCTAACWHSRKFPRTRSVRSASWRKCLGLCVIARARAASAYSARLRLAALFLCRAPFACAMSMQRSIAASARKASSLHIIPIACLAASTDAATLELRQRFLIERRCATRNRFMQRHGGLPLQFNYTPNERHGPDKRAAKCGRRYTGYQAY